MTAAARADRRLADVLAALDVLADAGDNKARHAAAVLRGGRSSGRPPIDDSAALARVDELTAAGRGREACGIVAASLATDPDEVASIAQRLRKRQRKRNARNGFSASPSGVGVSS